MIESREKGQHGIGSSDHLDQLRRANCPTVLQQLSGQDRFIVATLISETDTEKVRDPSIKRRRISFLLRHTTPHRSIFQYTNSLA